MILFIDDEYRFVKGYEAALKLSNFEVQFFETVESFFEFLDTFDDAKNKIELIIIDIMMPPGNRYIDRTYGRQTGLLMLEDLRKSYPLLPIILLTNKIDEPITTREPTYFLEKERTDPVSLVDFILTVLN